MIRQILLADDDSDDRLLFEEALYEIDPTFCELTSFSSGSELLRYLTSDRLQLPYVTVLDQNMPLMSGKETLRRIRQEPLVAGIPIVIYTTYHDRALVDECVALGIAAVVSKPDSYDGYRKMVNDILQYASRAAAVHQVPG